MNHSGDLETLLKTLISRYRQLALENAGLREQVEASESQIQALTNQTQALRLQLDELGKERFTVKKLKDERKQMRRKVVTALSRLEAIEQEIDQ